MESRPLDELEALHEPIWEFPTLISRLQATLIDTVVLITLWYAASLMVESLPVQSTWIKVVLFALTALYEPIATSLGQTVGQWVLGLKVVNRKGTSIHLIQALTRFVVKIPLGIISLITVHGDSMGRAIHDHVAGTIMVLKSRTASIVQERN